MSNATILASALTICLTAGANADEDGHNKYTRAVKGRAVGFFAPENIGQGVARRRRLLGHLGGDHRSKDENRQQQDQKNDDSLGIPENSPRGFQLPLGVRLGRGGHEPPPMFK